jgi:hypothetical protein
VIRETHNDGEDLQSDNGMDADLGSRQEKEEVWLKKKTSVISNIILGQGKIILPYHLTMLYLRKTNKIMSNWCSSNNRCEVACAKV